MGILITGSEGLVGYALCRALEARGEAVAEFDLRAARPQGRGDVRNRDEVAAVAVGCRGIVHLAAVSRVILGERDPALCEATNIGGTGNVLSVAARSSPRPFVIFASSREVYGAAASLPAREDSPLRPVNIYGRTKVEGERLVNAARAGGVRAVTIRLSNVYGSARDHTTRVVPAFARAAVLGEPLRVEGSTHTFDFTHVDDTVRGILALIDVLDAGAEAPPPIHFLTGRATTLGALADKCIELAASPSPRLEAPARAFDVSHFYGDPARARALLDWSPLVTLHDGVARLISAFRSELFASRARTMP